MTLRTAALRRRRQPQDRSPRLVPPTHRLRGWNFKMTLLTIAAVALLLYLISLILLIFSPRAQAALIFLNDLAPSHRLFSPSNLIPHRLSSTARHTTSPSGLNGWHILPPGPHHPLPPAQSSPDRDLFFDASLSSPRARVLIFFHGNAGHRAFPLKRVAMLRLLGAHLDAHVVTFDYAGFGDSPGTPSEARFDADALDSFAWLAARTAPDAHVIVYGQSLGTFAAVHLMAALFPSPSAERRLLRAKGGAVVRGVVLDAPPASVLEATMTHPSTRLYKSLPGGRRLAEWVLQENWMDSVRRLGDVGEEAPPMLVLHGRDDAMVGVEQGRSVSKAARAAGMDVRYVEFEGVGHINVNGADTFLEEMRNFVDKVFPGGLLGSER